MSEGQRVAKAPANFINPRQPRAKSRQISALRALLPFLRPYRMLIVFGAVVLLLTALLSLGLPVVVRRMLDDFLAGETVFLDRYFGFALGAVALFAFGTALRTYLISRLGEHVVTDVRKAIFNRVIDLSPAFYSNILTGEVLSRITTDTTLIQGVVGNSVSTALRSVVTFCGGLVLLFMTSFKLASIGLISVPFLVLPIYVIGRKMRLVSREAQDWIAASSGKAAESLSAVQTVQSFTYEDASKTQFSHYTDSSFDASHRRVQLRALLTFTVTFVVFMSVVVMLWIGARDVQAGRLSAGTLAQFVIYAMMVASALAALAQYWGELQRAVGATERLVELLNAQDTVVDPVRSILPKEPFKGRISFKNVSFSYPSRARDAALKNISFEVAPGETVALVGPSGAGKTTIIQLVQRFYDPKSGQIAIDGYDLKDMARTDFRKAIALVPQDPMIFAASASDNIRFGKPDASEEDVIAAARAADADAFITGFPDGYESYLGERGVMLSGGQKQRVAIARAILRDAPILLLDEATSSLDAQSEHAVQRAVEELSRDRTTLIIAHRLATVKKADRIIVLDKGEIVASGTHEELLKAGGLYARLAKLQFLG